MDKEAEKSLARALDWLLVQQAADGGWHSAAYGQLKDGAAVTALALYALAHLPAPLQSAYKQSWSKATSFLTKGTAKRGTVAGPDGTLDFPTYATALLLKATSDGRDSGLTGVQRNALVDYLAGAQVGETRGFKPDSPSYGGWDFLGRDDAHGITTGTNISVTRYAIEALFAEIWISKRRLNGSNSITAAEEAMARGTPYVLRCQQPDGGFAFTCEPASLNNKAAYHDEKLTRPRSYGTATCDGVRALLACALRPSDEPVAKGLAWLAKRPVLEVVSGFEGLPPELGWQLGLRFYYYAALAPLLKFLPDQEARQAALQQHLLKLQKADGSWTNESDRMRENDPLIATALAIVVLSSVA